MSSGPDGSRTRVQSSFRNSFYIDILLLSYNEQDYPAKFGWHNQEANIQPRNPFFFEKETVFIKPFLIWLVNKAQTSPKLR